MKDEVRKAGDYTIIHSLHIGDREVVLGEDMENLDGQKYMCAFCTSNGLFAKYDDVLAGDDYPEIVKVYGQRIAEQAEKTRVELFTPKFQGIPNAPLTAKNCTLISHDDDLNGKIVVIKPDVLRREYRMATRQIKLCTGGFGASPHSRGSPVTVWTCTPGKNPALNGMTYLALWSRSSYPSGRSWGLQSTAKNNARLKKRRHGRWIYE